MKSRRTLHPTGDSSTPWFIHLDVQAKFDDEVKRWVAGSHKLDVWSSGKDPKEALDRAEQAIFLFLNEAERMGTIWDVLENAGIPLHTARAPEPEPVFERVRDAFKSEYRFPLAFKVPPSTQDAHAE